ncbi:VOC family protein [Marinobacterium sp. D7]|uniref:VOC family protein n=1 Tax=Marinobacterium ramblicola TaxID=2849041 RepID=UPI001C2DE151|nr:VOC family protein [Marinobacterium ramblicola]MBV1788521.1 VOC family protein [Marinobacterium ramblicola]
MANKQGDFLWYELLTDDADAAQAFYSDVIGWQTVDSGVPNMDYRILQATDPDSGEVNPVGGMMPLTEEMRAGGARPVWLGYIAVEDVDHCVARITEAGGRVMLPPFDIDDVGRIAMVTDPQGVPFYIMRGFSEETSLAFAFDRPRVGHCGWNELRTTDPAAAKQFYGELFGWQKEGEMDMGEEGCYEFLRHGSVLGAVMPKPDTMPMPMWHFYFRVADIDRAVDKIASAGGQLTFGPVQVPGGDYIVKGIDPQGASFSLVGARQE